jgi:hypothetical protein
MNPFNCIPHLRLIIGNHGNDVVKKCRSLNCEIGPAAFDGCVHDWRGWLIVDHEGWKRDLWELKPSQLVFDPMCLTFEKFHGIDGHPFKVMGMVVFNGDRQAWAINPFVWPDRPVELPNSEYSLTAKYHLNYDHDNPESYIPINDLFSIDTLKSLAQ